MCLNYFLFFLRHAAWNSIVAHVLDPELPSGCLVLAETSSTRNADNLSDAPDWTSIARALSALLLLKASLSLSSFDPVQEKIRRDASQRRRALGKNDDTSFWSFDLAAIDGVSTRNALSLFDPVREKIRRENVSQREESRESSNKIKRRL